MDRFEGYVQVLNMSEIPLELLVSPAEAVELAKIANDGMAELVMKFPDQFIAAIACLPLGRIEAALNEMERAIEQLRFRGIQIPSSIQGKSLDSPEFEPIFAKMHEYNLPILVHPESPNGVTRIPNEPGRAGEIERVSFGPFDRPLETSLMMGHLVYSGMMGKYPELKIITHHCGGLVPYHASRLQAWRDLEEMRRENGAGYYFPKKIVDYYRMFYADTACNGNPAGLTCCYQFFGADHVLFGTDFPQDNANGDRNLRDTIEAIEQMAVSEEDKKKIFEANAKRLFRLPL